ncbi:hypothetical protein [Clavibacter michiganensis]|uniref:hypothetical protein n=1 Tax=Clavibacter michiganensis TaxID=28447 RepID=UPI000B64FA63|nr:hypothetical protein [Clavibacter michiganensis]MDO4099249.1 hypothetical protein [Clavibacter michiganensis]MDO4127402.1 hypothetical protein [Clavibacter michiganensis]NIY61802.1 hypothetical protein [Clavibacter michiganensis subsp. michiganensis]OUE11359.1 hypothetical protein CMMCA001_13425 [Clavibacter michiganensis subsp. michiganensis]QXP02793.1 hypothetical protein KN218_14760 [Clavibacter michiganensis subsp. michiganensis]
MTYEPFATTTRDSRPVNEFFDLLRRDAANKLQSISSTSELRQFAEEEAPRLKADVRDIVPELGGSRPARVDEPEWKRAEDNSTHKVARHYIATEIIGDPHLLCYWPRMDFPILPVDDHDAPRAGLTVELRREIWEIARYNESDGKHTWGLYTSIYLTPHEEQLIQSGQLDVNGIFTRRREYVEPIIRKLLSQAKNFAINEYPEWLDNLLQEKLLELQARESVSRSLVFPSEWKMSPLLLEDEVSGDVDGPVIDLADIEISIRPTPHLAAKSFAELQQVIRRWTDAIERYPRAFSDLSEDQLSDLLAATLNATMPGANREVYTRTGKSDIFIQADILHKGSGPEKVFIAESKWARSVSIVQKALDPQLFSYLSARDTAAVLLLLFKQKDPQKAALIYLAALESVAGFQCRSESAVEEWPILTYSVEGRTVSVCVATVFLPAYESANLQEDDDA